MPEIDVMKLTAAIFDDIRAKQVAKTRCVLGSAWAFSVGWLID